MVRRRAKSGNDVRAIFNVNFNPRVPSRARMT
jgi:hypothetical protein